MAWFPILRLSVFGFVLLCAIIVIGLSGDVTAVVEKFHKTYFGYSALGIAVSLMTFFTLPPMIVLGIYRSGSFITTVLAELVWLSIMFILWLSTGAAAASSFNTNWVTCDWHPAEANRGCQETQAIIAFGFLAAIALFGYVLTEFILALLSNSNGNPVWTASAVDAFIIPPSFASGPTGTEKQNVQQTSQHPYPPSTQPVAQV